MTNSQQTLIHVTLLAGEPPWIRIASIPHHDVQAILIPRNKLSEAEQHSEWNRLAVYLLFGKSEETAEPAVYIGQTDTAWERLSNHNRTKDFWKTAIVVISKTEDGLTHDDIQWLEWRCIQKAKEINSFVVHSGRDPDEPSIIDSMKGGMSVFFNSLCTLVSILGYPVFEPEENIDPPPVRGTLPLTDLSTNEVFYCRGKHADATGAFVEDGFVVRKGSIARLDIVPSAIETVGPMQRKLRESGILVEEEGNLRFTRDHLFLSPSGAAAIVLGRNADGWIEWENKDGKPLNEIKRASGVEHTEPTDP